MLDISTDLSSLFTGMDNIAREAVKSTRKAAYSMAKVYYERVLENVPVAGEHVGKGGKVYPGGLLKSSIYHAFSDDHSQRAARDDAYTKAVYHVSWNHAKAPHGWMIENGHKQTHVAVEIYDKRLQRMRWISTVRKTPRDIAPRSYIRRSYIEVDQAAQAAGLLRFQELMAKVLQP
jgi:hypothetical protein